MQISLFFSASISAFSAALRLHFLRPFDDDAITPMATALEQAQQLDRNDALRSFASRFIKPPGKLYLDGNSLGLASVDAIASLQQSIDDWKQFAIEGWTDASPPWIAMARALASDVAPLIGASPDEVIIANSTTVNLHQLLATLYSPTNDRDRIAIDALSFPTDSYAVQSFLTLKGFDWREKLLRIPSRDGLTIQMDDITLAMRDNVAICVLPAVVYTSGQLLDLRQITRLARQANVIIGWDCSHSIGAVRHALDECDADFAFWCSYKYLNAGPGAAGGLYLNHRHFGKSPGLAGWFSSATARQFDMADELHAAPDAAAMQIGTPNIFSMAPLIGSLKIIHEAGLDRMRAKSLALTRYLMELIDEHLAPLGFSIGTPRDDSARGGHVALLHDDAFRIARAMRANGIVPDFRPPKIIRLAPIALYNSFEECFNAIEGIRRIMVRAEHLNFAAQRDLVS